MNKLDMYQAVRGQIKTGDLLLWHSNSVIGALIRWKTDSEYNHASLAINFQEFDRLVTSEALEHGTVINFLSRRLEQFDGRVWWLALTDEWDDRRQSIGAKALELIGIPYDYESLLAQLFGRVSADARHLFCSEYCYLALGFTGTAPTPADMPGLGIYKPPVLILDSTVQPAAFPDPKSSNFGSEV